MKLKYFVSGLIAGALLMITVSSYAEPVFQKISAIINKYAIIKLNGEKVDLNNPILNYDGKTYVYVKEIGELVGIDVKWNSKEKSVEIGNAPEKDDLEIELLHDYIKGAVEQEYPHFKSLFQVVDKILNSDNRITVFTSHSGDSVQHLDEFFEYFNKLGENKVLLMERFALEMYEQNLNYPVSVFFQYSGVFSHLLGSVSIDADGTIISSEARKIINTKPDATKLN